MQPQTYNLVIPEEKGTDVRFRLTPLEDHEASDHRSTTMIDQRLLGSQLPNLAVILVAAKNGAILTCSRNSRDSARSTHTSYTLIPSYGDQDIDLAHSTASSQTRSTQAPGALLELAPKSIAEWVAAIPSRGDDPSKPPNPSIENSPLAWVDGVETANDDTKTSQPKRRFGRNRQKPGLDDITEIEDHGVTTFDYTNDDHHSTLTMPLSSKEGKLSDPSAKLASSTLSTSKTPSHSGSQKSPPADTSSSTPSTQSSTTHHDLLMLAEPALAYPVMIPISNPATSCHDIGSRTSQASFAQAPPPPAWVRRNVTSQAENQRPGLLVDCADTERPSSQPVSYLAAAKRGTSTVGTRGLSGGPANINHGSNLLHQLQPPTSSPDQAQSVNWSAPKTTRRAGKARSKVATVVTHQTGQTVQLQDNAVRRVDNNLSQPDDSVVIQLLQLAKGLGGIVRMEVEIGRILVKTDGIQPSKSGWANVYNAWLSIFGLRDGQTETIFTNR